MLTMILPTFICQNLSFFFFFDWTRQGVGEGEYLGCLPTSHPPRWEEVSLLSSFFQSIKRCLKHEIVVECKRILCNNLVFKNEFYCSFKQKTWGKSCNCYSINRRVGNAIFFQLISTTTTNWNIKSINRISSSNFVVMFLREENQLRSREEFID